MNAIIAPFVICTQRTCGVVSALVWNKQCAMPIWPLICTPLARFVLVLFEPTTCTLFFGSYTVLWEHRSCGNSQSLQPFVAPFRRNLSSQPFSGTVFMGANICQCCLESRFFLLLEHTLPAGPRHRANGGSGEKYSRAGVEEGYPRGEGERTTQIDASGAVHGRFHGCCWHRKLQKTEPK